MMLHGKSPHVHHCEVMLADADLEEGQGPAGWCGAVLALHSLSHQQPFVLLHRAVVALGGTSDDWYCFQTLP